MGRMFLSADHRHCSGAGSIDNGDISPVEHESDGRMVAFCNDFVERAWFWESRSNLSKCQRTEKADETAQNPCSEENQRCACRRRDHRGRSENTDADDQTDNNHRGIKGGELGFDGHPRVSSLEQPIA